MEWLIFLTDTDLLDIRTKTTLSAVLKNIDSEISLANLKIYEVIKTLNPSTDYNYFVNEEYAFSNAKDFLNKNNVSMVSNKKELGSRLVINLNVTSISFTYANKIMIKKPEENRKFSKQFT